MRIVTLELAGLRGFAAPETIHFASPSGLAGSGLTILIGPNNGGKSTIVEAFRALASNHDESFTEGKRNKEAGGRVSIVATFDGGQRRGLQTVEMGGSETVRLTTTPGEVYPTLYVLPSRRYFNPYFGRGTLERQSYAENIRFPQSRGAALDQFSGRLFRALQKRPDFDRVLQRVLDPVPDWTIDQSDSGQYYLKFDAGGQYHTSDGLGEGIVSLFFIVDALYDSLDSEIIVIDEPELSLHPALQRRLASLLADYAKDRQIVYATHSPYFVDFTHVMNGAEVTRVHKPGASCKVSQLRRSTAAALTGFLTNINNPHILGLDAREAFFVEDGIVLVEGQEDVILYSRILETLGLDLASRFFGWGVGGVDNLASIAALLCDLGFTRVCGILDANKADRIPQLRTTFPAFHFAAIPAVDVRTKPARPAMLATHGLLNENGQLRPEFEESVRRIFTEVQDYLAPVTLGPNQ